MNGSNKQAGNGPSRRPAQGSKRVEFLNIQKDTIVKISSIFHCRITPEEMRIRLENHFAPT